MYRVAAVFWRHPSIRAKLQNRLAYAVSAVNLNIACSHLSVAARYSLYELPSRDRQSLNERDLTMSVKPPDVQWTTTGTRHHDKERRLGDLNQYFPV